MTDTPDRRIGGLAPRAGAGQTDLSRLQRRNRPVTPEPAAEEEAKVTPLPRATAPDRTKPATPAAPVTPAATAEAGPPDRITVYLDRALRERARTAYRATAHLEGDRTWSDFIERAILAEVERREHAHNADQTYSSTPGKLAPGRNVS